MRLENTKANKDRFIASYWGNNVQFDDMQLNIDGKLFRVYDTNDCTVLAQSLDKLTDADARQLSYNDSTNCQMFKSCEQFICYKSAKQFLEDYVAIGHLTDFEASKLRSMGYAIPFEGVPVPVLEAWGWLKKY
jgi:hypothetical protein